MFLGNIKIKGIAQYIIVLSPLIIQFNNRYSILKTYEKQACF